jgi:hypothetical protein
VTEYVLTPQNGDKVIYGVLDAHTDHEAGLNVLRAVTGDDVMANQIFFHKALAEAAEADTNIEDSTSLVGLGWFELAPTEPMPGGQPGGERQDGDALARRFALKRPDGNWAVVTRHVYLATPLGEPLDSDELVIEESFEFLVCKDLHDVHGTEFFAYETFTGLPYEPSATTMRREAFLMFPTDILWDGQEFEDREHSKLVRP